MNFQPTESDLLMVIDMQEDFINGPLGSQQARDIVDGIANVIENFPGTIYFTRDTHHDDYMNTQEGHRLPVKHCIEGTPGHQIVQKLRDAASESDCTVITNKKTFGSVNLFDFIKRNHFHRIYFCGVCTGICVISNAVLAKTADTESEIIILENLCACVTPASHATAINAMKTLQMDVITV